MRRRHAAWIFAAALVAAPTLRAGEPDGLAIAAVAGDSAITSYDVENRMRFIFATTQLSDSMETRQRISSQVVRSLIDERLQLQEAARNGIDVTALEVAKAIASVEAERGMPEGAIYAMLASRGIPEEAYQNQIKAQVAWSKLVGKKIKPHVRVSEEEVEFARHKVAQGNVRQELQIAPLTLAIDKPENEAEVKRLAQKLAGEIRAGANFEELARQFGGGAKPEPFWVQPEQVAPELGKALADAKPGSVAGPVRTGEGYLLVKVYHARASSSTPVKDAEVTLKEILLKLKADATPKEANVMLAIGEAVAAHPGSCADKTLAGISNLEDFDIVIDFRNALLSELPQALRVIAENLQAGDSSAPFASADGLRLYVLCERKERTSRLPARESVLPFLLQQKLELEAQKYLRNLRRDSFIEIR